MVGVSPSATRLDDFVLHDAIFDLLNLTGAAHRLSITSCLVNSFSKSSQILSIADVAQTMPELHLFHSAGRSRILALIATDA